MQIQTQGLCIRKDGLHFILDCGVLGSSAQNRQHRERDQSNRASKPFAQMTPSCTAATAGLHAKSVEKVVTTF